MKVIKRLFHEKSLARESIQNRYNTDRVCSIFLPVNPAPAAPNKDAMTARPAVVLRTAALLAPRTAPAPAAISGAARPPVTPKVSLAISQTT